MNLQETTFPASPSGPHLPALLLQPTNPIALIVFGHGAGTPMRAPLMHHMAQALANHRIATFRYDYPYSHRLRDGYTENLIDPLKILLQTTRAAIQAARQLAPDLPLFLAGRSMSGQVMSLLLAQQPRPHAKGLICYVYPNRWRVLLPDTITHLPHVPVPILFIQATRDPEYSDLSELQTVLEQLHRPDVIPASPAGTQRQPSPPAQPATPFTLHLKPTSPPNPPLTSHDSPLTPRFATLHLIKDADHSFHFPPDSQTTRQHAITEAASVTATWIQIQLDTPAT